jgi:hypothetical protein
MPQTQHSPAAAKPPRTLSASWRAVAEKFKAEFEAAEARKHHAAQSAQRAIGACAEAQ